MEIGKIEKPKVQTFSEKRKLYLVPTLPFEELKLQFGLDAAKIERFWGEVREKIDYFISTYGDISAIFLEGIDETEEINAGFPEKFGKDSNHYRFIKNLMDRGAKPRGIEKEEHLKISKLLLEEYAKSFLPEMKELYEGFFRKNIDIEGWRSYLIKKINDVQDEMRFFSSRIVENALGETGSGVLIITEGRQIEFPQGVDVFQIRPPAFDEIARKMRESMK